MSKFLRPDPCHDGSSDDEKSSTISYLPLETHEKFRFERGKQHHAFEQYQEASAANPAAYLKLNACDVRKSSQEFVPQNECLLDLPQYIRKPPTWLEKEDVEYLSAKGAFSIPDVDLRNELLQAYVRYSYVNMPLLELNEFLSAVLHCEDTQPISLLLFQAVMFAGTNFIDLEHLQAAGYSHRDVAREVFFQRARLLYKMNYETERICLVQSTLLLTTWNRGHEDLERSWHWIGVSLYLAHTVGLHRGGDIDLVASQKKVWRRVWWSIFTRDRLISLSLRRPTHVKDDERWVTLITLEDFDFCVFSTKIVRIIGNDHILQNIHNQRKLALIFVEKVKLCQCMSHLLATQFSLHQRSMGIPLDINLTPTLENDHQEIETACRWRCDQEIQVWLANLPKEIHSSLSEAPRVSDVLYLPRAVLKMIYLSFLIALHGPRRSSDIFHFPADDRLQSASQNRLGFAAAEITKLSSGPYSADLMRRYPAASVTLLSAAVIIHLQGIKSDTPRVRMASVQRFYPCILNLRLLRDSYTLPDRLDSFTKLAVGSFESQLPL